MISGPTATAQQAPSPLRGRAAFAALRRGRRVRRGPITVTWAAGDPAGPARVGYSVGRRVGGAVVRNRIRRRLRAVVRDIGADLAPGAYLVGAGAEAATLPYELLKTTLSEAVHAVSGQERV